MLANIIRTQARNALVSCRARASIAGVVSQLAARRATPVFVTVSRPFSSSRISKSFGMNGFTQPVPEKEPTNTLYLGNLPFSVAEQEIREKFGVYGTIEACRIAFRNDGTSRGFAHLQFARTADAIAAYQSVAEEPMFIMDRDIQVDYAPVRKLAVQEPYHKLFFQGFGGDEAMLREAAKEFESTILSIFFLKDAETGEFTGKGFIDFMTIPRATEALERLNGLQLSNGTSLHLSFARPPKVRYDPVGQRSGRRSFGGEWEGGRRDTEYSRGGRGGGRGGYSGRGRGGGYGSGGYGSEGRSQKRYGQGGEEGY